MRLIHVPHGHKMDDISLVFQQISMWTSNMLQKSDNGDAVDGVGLHIQYASSINDELSAPALVH